MLKSCKYCGRIHPKGYDCQAKPKRYKSRTQQTDIRCTNKWTRKSIEIRERDHYLCRVCLAQGTVNYDGIEVHHIIPLVEDGSCAFDDDWLISLCASHHKAADRGEISRQALYRLACGGTPLPSAFSTGETRKTTKPPL